MHASVGLRGALRASIDWALRFRHGGEERGQSQRRIRGHRGRFGRLELLRHFRYAIGPGNLTQRLRGLFAALHGQIGKLPVVRSNPIAKRGSVTGAIFGREDFRLGQVVVLLTGAFLARGLGYALRVQRRGTQKREAGQRRCGD
jgi:hypothetical protein